MLKKSLFVVATVAMLAVAAQAGDLKIHTWPTTFVPQEITSIPVVMDIGYWVRIKDQGNLKIKLLQTSTLVYEGSTAMTVECNFPIHLTCSISKDGPVGGDFSCDIDNKDVDPTGATVNVSAKLTKADLKGATAGEKNVKVATVKIFVVPRVS
jgi:hypothetical protein